MMSKNLDCTTDMQWSCKTWRRSGLKVIHAKSNSARGAEKSSNIRTSRWKPKIRFCRQFSGICESLRRAKFESWEIKPHRSETGGIAERAVQRVKADASSVLVQSGLQESWWAEAMECYCNLRTVQDLLADSQTPCERRFNSPFKGPIFLTGAEVKTNPMSPQNRGRVHQFGTKVLPGIFVGYALDVGGSWTGDLLIGDREDLKNDATIWNSLKKRFKSKEADILKRNNEFVFPCRTCEILQDGQSLSTRFVQSAWRLQAISSRQILRRRSPRSRYRCLKLDNITGVIGGDYVYRNHVPRTKLHVPIHATRKIGVKESLSDCLECHQTSRPERIKLGATLCKRLVCNWNESVQFLHVQSNIMRT